MPSRRFRLVISIQKELRDSANAMKEPANLEDNHLSPQAQQARDEIVDLILQGQQVRAIRRYIQASGKGISEAKTVIDRLSELLEKPGLDAAEKAFLAGFRATLNCPERPPPERGAAELSREASAEDANPDTNALDPLPTKPPRVRAAVAGRASSPRAGDNSRKDSLRIDWEGFVTGGGALMLLLSVICIGGSAYTLVRGFAQDSWAKVPGNITQARIAAPTQPGKPRRKLFAYEYQVDDKTYSSERYSFENVGGDRSVGIQRYSPGDRVTVYYNPQNPSIAVLEKKKPGFFVVVVLILGIVFLLASIGSLLARNAMALFTRAGVRGLLSQLASRREKPLEPPADKRFDARDPDAHGAPPLPRKNPLSHGDWKNEAPNHRIVPWYAYLAAFVIGTLLIWLPGRLIDLFHHMGAGFLSELLGAGVTGVGFGGIAFGFAYFWSRHSSLWGMMVSFPACAMLLGWLMSTVLSNPSVPTSLLFTVAIAVTTCMGLSVLGGHLGAERYRMQKRMRSDRVLAEGEISNTAFAAPTPLREFLNDLRKRFKGENVPWFGWLALTEKTSNRLWGLAGLLLALAGLFYVGKNIFLAAGQDDWVPVPAVVVSSETTKTSKGSGFSTYYSSRFKYRYQVDGIRYTGDRYSFWSLGGDPSEGVALYRPGDHLTVYHHPTYPHYAAVELRSPSLFTWSAGLLLLLIAIPSGWMLWTGKSNG